MSKEQETQGGFSIPHVLSILKRRKYLILGIVLIATTLSVMNVNQLVPIFSAETSLVVEPSRQRTLNIKSVVSNLDTDRYTNATEAAVIGSRELARKAVIKLDLINNPLFNYKLRPQKKSLMGLVTRPIKKGFSNALTWGRDLITGGRYSIERKAKKAARLARGPRLTPEEKREQEIEDPTDSYMNSLTVSPARRSRVIEVKFSSSDPKMAALAVSGAGLVVAPDDDPAVAAAVAELASAPGRRAAFGRVARERALDQWNREAILERFEAQLLEIT